jgi:putative component of membrane protein insertase Oxa1/YidC/SpoIIIJ protein YidD
LLRRANLINCWQLSARSRVRRMAPCRPVEQGGTDIVKVGFGV